MRIIDEMKKNMIKRMHRAVRRSIIEHKNGFCRSYGIGYCILSRVTMLYNISSLLL
jgi:hypothetical protein